MDEWEVTTYEYDGRGLTTKQTDALGNVTEYEYDGNGNLVYKVDADAMVTEFTYNALDMVTHINYNGGKEVDYVYNAVGDLVRMEDWTGINTFEYDLLSQLKRVTDHKGNVVEYTYDGNGNQTSLTYPDDTTVEFTYDLVNNLSTVTESDGRTTSYEYDGMGRVVRMEYPHGWVEEYEYGSIGQLLRVTDIDPSQKDMKQQKHIYEYDTCGNMTYEYMRGNGTGEATVENTYTYDALHRITNVHEDYGNDNRSYTYDSLGNLTYETAQGNKSVDYILNNLNQVVESSDDGWKSQTAYTYDGRGNLVEKAYGKNKKVTTVGEYVYDETNRMVLGYNALRESSEYLYNGLGALVTNTWVIAKNGYGYHDVDSLVSEMSVLTGQELMDALEIYNEDTLAETVNLHYFGDEIAPNLDPSAPDDSDLLEEEPDTDLEQPDEEEPVVEPERPDEEEPVVEPEQPDEEEPVVEPEQPDEEEPVVEPEQPDEEESVVEPEQPDEEKPVVEPEQPNKEEPAVESGSPDMDASDTAESPVPEMTEEPDVQIPEPSEETPDVEKPESEVPPEVTLPETKEPTLEEPEVSDLEEQVPDTPATAPDSNQGNGNSAGNNGQGNGNNASNGDGNGSLNKTSTVVKEFMVDYNTETFEPLMEHEVNGLDYKYVYGNDRLSVDITPIPQGANHIIENGDHVRLYYHMDYLGTADYLTSPVSLKVEAWTHYDEWGRITHNAVLKCGQRELDLVKRYATHDYDSVLELYYAKARFYDANGRHFVAMDPILDASIYSIKDYVNDPKQLVQYLYVINNPIIYIDILGERYLLIDNLPVEVEDTTWETSGYVQLRELISILNENGIRSSVFYNEKSHSAVGYINHKYYSINFNDMSPLGNSNLLGRGYSRNMKQYFASILCTTTSTSYVGLDQLMQLVGLSDRVMWVDKYLETQLNTHDIDAGIRVTVIGGRQYLDVTIPVETAVYNAQTDFSFHMRNYSWFMDQVNHRMPWDIKREEPWESTIGTTYPGEHNTQIVFQGRVVTPEMLGNITYGYLGSAASMSEFELIAGGDYAAGGIEGIFTGADSEEDKAAIRTGITWFYNINVADFYGLPRKEY